jgi:hypothetical protein
VPFDGVAEQAAVGSRGGVGMLGGKAGEKNELFADGRLAALAPLSVRSGPADMVAGMRARSCIRACTVSPGSLFVRSVSTAVKCRGSTDY